MKGQRMSNLQAAVEQLLLAQIEAACRQFTDKKGIKVHVGEIRIGDKPTNEDYWFIELGYKQSDKWYTLICAYSTDFILDTSYGVAALTFEQLLEVTTPKSSPSRL